MRGAVLVWLLALAAALAGGCRSRSDLVEAELRLKDRQLRELAGERERLAELNEAYATTLAGAPPYPMPGRGGAAPTHIKDIQVGRGTGGLDEDKCEGDEGIMVVIVPRDCDESAVKAPGTAHVTALEITPEGIKTPLSTWELSAAHLRRTWKSGLLSTGYYVALPWQAVPCTAKLRVVVRFQTPDGATFEAERDIQVRLPGGTPAIVPSGPAPTAPPSGFAPLPTGPNVPAQPPPGPLDPPRPEGPTTLPPPTPVPTSGPPLSGTSNYRPSERPATLLPPRPRPAIVLERPIQ